MLEAWSTMQYAPLVNQADSDNEEASRRPGRETGRPRPSQAATYRTGILLGAGLSLIGILAALVSDTALSPLILLSGWATVAWSTHRMGRSGPLKSWPMSRSEAPQRPRSDRG